MQRSGLIVLVRRALVALFAGIAVASAIRVRGGGSGLLPQHGGWRELRGDDLR